MSSSSGLSIELESDNSGASGNSKKLNFLREMHGEVKIDLVCGENISRLSFPTTELTLPDSNELLPDDEAIQVIYGNIGDHIRACGWFDIHKNEQIKDFFTEIISAENGKRVHIRGLTYFHFGRDISIMSNYAKSIKSKCCTNNKFVMKYDLERAFSSDAGLLATVTDNIVPVNIRPYMSGLSRASFEHDGESVGYIPSTESQPSRYLDFAELKASDAVSALGDATQAVQPRTVYYESSSDTFNRRDHRNERDRNKYHAREDFTDPRTKMDSGQRRYTMNAGNIPGTSLLKKQRPKSATLICNDSQTPELRTILLMTIANNRIPEQRHRNYGTVTNETMIDTECFLVW